MWLEWVITVHELRTMLISLTWRVEDRDAYVVRIDHHSPWIENSVGKLDFKGRRLEKRFRDKREKTALYNLN